MQMFPVESTQIAELGYDDNSLLRVSFKRGGLYEYDGVTTEEASALFSPGEEYNESVGIAFARIIKGIKRYRKVTDDGTEEAWTLPTAGANASKPSGSSPVVTMPKFAATVAQPVADAVDNPGVDNVSRNTDLLVSSASEIQVIDPATQAQASEFLLAVARMRREIAETFKPMKDAAFRAHRVICDQERSLDAPLQQVDAKIRTAIGAYVSEQRRLALKADQEARDAEMARARLESERIAQEQAIEDAIVLEAQGATKAAEAVLANPAPAPLLYVAPAPVVPLVAQVKGVSIREDWDFNIINAELVPREFLLVNEQALRALGKSTKGKARVPGVEFFEKPVVSTRRA